MIKKFCSLSIVLAGVISGCASFPELEKTAPQDDPTAEFIEFLTSERLNEITYRPSPKTQPFNEAQLASMRRRADKLRNQIFADN